MDKARRMHTTALMWDVKISAKSPYISTHVGRSVHQLKCLLVHQLSASKNPLADKHQSVAATPAISRNDGRWIDARKICLCFCRYTWLLPDLNENKLVTFNFVHRTFNPWIVATIIFVCVKIAILVKTRVFKSTHLPSDCRQTSSHPHLIGPFASWSLAL